MRDLRLPCGAVFSNIELECESGAHVHHMHRPLPNAFWATGLPTWAILAQTWPQLRANVPPTWTLCLPEWVREIDGTSFSSDKIPQTPPRPPKTPQDPPKTFQDLFNSASGIELDTHACLSLASFKLKQLQGPSRDKCTPDVER